MLSAVCVDPNLEGYGEFFLLERNTRHYHHRDSDMLSSNIYRNLSSSIVFESSFTDATLILFNKLLIGINTGDFNGNFLQITNVKDSGSSLQVDNFSNYNFNDVTTSLMLIATNRDGEVEDRTSFRGLYLNTWNRFLDDVILADLDPPAERRGSSLFTWTMFPEYILSPNLCYLRIYQPLKIKIKYWFDYNASMTFYIYLYLDSQGRVTPILARWEITVDDGVLRDEILILIRDKIVYRIDGLIDETLKPMLHTEFGSSNKGIYYLPGRQSRTPSEIHQGSTTDDVTIVVTKEGEEEVKPDDDVAIKEGESILVKEEEDDIVSKEYELERPDDHRRGIWDKFRRGPPPGEGGPPPY